MSLKVYAYAGCGTCKKALAYLERRGLDHEVVAIRETPPTMTELRKMLAIYGGDVRKLFNTSGGDYKALGLSDKLGSMKVDDALRLLAGNGNLVKRPFVLGKKGGVVGFKENEWTALE